MTEEPLFTPDELDEMGTRLVDLVERAIDAGDTERAKKLNRRLYREGLAAHDMYRDWVTALFAFVGKHYGDEALERAFEESMQVWLEPLLELYEGQDIRRRVQLCAAGLRGHCQPVEIREDEDKFVFKMKPCGSGGRQILEGKYEGPRGFPKVEQPQAMTFGRADFPVYCCHGHFMAKLPFAWGRPPAFWEIPSAKLGEEPCEFWLFKDPSAIPEEEYARVGIEKANEPSVG